MEMTRRKMFAATSAAALTTFTRSALGGWEPSERYPDPAIKSLDPSFNRYRLFNASIERLATGMRWCEGPVYFGDGRCLIWSDIPNNRLMRYDEVTSAVSVYREPSNHANGNRRDRQGRLVTCEHETRRITQTEYDGTITVLMNKFEGKRLNSPNDISVKSDDSIWLSDPPFGILNNYQGNVSPIELPSNIYRLDPKTGRATVVESTLSRPNGVEFSPDETKCYIQDSGSTPRHIYGLRPGRQRHAACQQARLDHRGTGGHAGRLPRRRGRQFVVRLGHGLRRPRRRQSVQSRRQADRLYCAA